MPGSYQAASESASLVKTDRISICTQLERLWKDQVDALLAQSDFASPTTEEHDGGDSWWCRMHQSVQHPQGYAATRLLVVRSLYQIWHKDDELHA